MTELYETTVGLQPAPFSDSIIGELRWMIPTYVPADHVIHDPFGGEGVKLGKLCDELGYTFTGTDMERWKGHDPRVRLGNSMDAHTYRDPLFAIVTSPTYCNGINDHWTPHEDSKRLTYRIRAGHPLDDDNTGRWSGRGSARAEAEYWRITRECVKHWGDIAIVNVKDSYRAGVLYPLVQLWADLLAEYGYAVRFIKVPTPSWRVGTNHEARVADEDILLGVRVT